jgi:hypothetical protein
MTVASWGNAAHRFGLLVVGFMGHSKNRWARDIMGKEVQRDATPSTIPSPYFCGEEHQ